MTSHKDDIPITDYAFGEMDDDQRESIEQSLANDPSAQTRLNELLDTALQLEEEFAQEFSQDIGLDDKRKNRINRRLELLGNLHNRRRTRPAHWKWWITYLPLGLIAVLIIFIILIWYAYFN